MRHLDQKPFGHAPDGAPIDLFILDNDRGVEATITNFGGIVVSLSVPDRRGDPRDVVLGFPDAGGYAVNKPHFGALIGRYGTGSRLHDSRWTASSTPWPPTTARITTCMAV